MDFEDNFIKPESVKFERTASGKYVYSFRLNGNPEELIEKVKKLKEEYDSLVIKEEIKFNGKD